MLPRSPPARTPSSHTLLWFVEDAPALSDRARIAIEDLDNTPVYSIASVWEMAIKVGVGKLAMSRPLYPEFARLLQERGFEQLQISYRHASEVARLPWHHRSRTCPSSAWTRHSTTTPLPASGSCARRRCRGLCCTRR